MVKITEYQLRKSEDGREFYALTLQSGIEIVKSQNGNMYATAKKTSIPCTFNEIICQSLIGQEISGNIKKVECEEYTFFLPETGETITRSHKYEYCADEVSNIRPIPDIVVNPKPSTNGQFQHA